MNKEDARLCKDCIHCIRVPDTGGYMEFCENPKTKELDPPIGFLDQRARACEYFGLSTKATIRVILEDKVYA